MMHLSKQIMDMVEPGSEFDGLALSAIRETGTGRLLSVYITPVDVIDDEMVPRYVAETGVTH